MNPGWPQLHAQERLAPVRPEDLSPQAREVFDTLSIGTDGGEIANLLGTLAHHPRLLKRWTAFGGVLLFRGELSARDRELLILRTAWNTKAHYEWTHHQDLAKAAGLTDDEIARVEQDPVADEWPAEDAALLRAADELHEAARIDDDTWAKLAARYSPAQLVEMCMLVGQYHLVGFTVNSLGVQLEH